MSPLPVKWIAYLIQKFSVRTSILGRTAWKGDRSSTWPFCGSISGKEFILLLEASSAASRSSYDLVFQALEKMLVSERECQTSTVTDGQLGSASDVKSSPDRLSDQNISSILNYIDCSKLSEEALQRLAQNEHIPHDLWLKKLLSAYSQLRSQVQSCNSATLIEQLGGYWSAKGQTDRVQVPCQSKASGTNEFQLVTKSRLFGHWTIERQSIKEEEIYIPVSVSLLARQLQSSGGQWETSRNEVYISRRRIS